MKSLKFKKLNLLSGDILSREALKTITGGDGDGYDDEECSGSFCKPCNSDAECNYAPNRYCTSYPACPQYAKVCLKAGVC